MPSGIDGFMSGMSSWGPWVVFSKMPDLGATNTLYVVRFLHAKTREKKAAWAMWLLTTRIQRQLRCIGRRYADGLLKFEPSDIANLPIEIPIKFRGALAAYKRAVRLLLSGDTSASRRIADAWFPAVDHHARPVSEESSTAARRGVSRPKGDRKAAA
jgi:hypothetical protein